MAINTIMDESEVGGNKLSLSLREFDMKLNKYTLRQLKQIPTYGKIINRPDFYSPSVHITNDSLIRQRVA